MSKHKRSSNLYPLSLLVITKSVGREAIFHHYSSVLLRVLSLFKILSPEKLNIERNAIRKILLFKGKPIRWKIQKKRCQKPDIVPPEEVTDLQSLGHFLWNSRKLECDRWCLNYAYCIGTWYGVTGYWYVVWYHGYQNELLYLKMCLNFCSSIIPWDWEAPNRV